MRQQYTELRSRIEDAIEAALPVAAGPEWLDAIGASAAGGQPLSGDEVGSRATSSLLAPARDLVGRGGKRWRPLLLALAAEEVALSRGLAGRELEAVRALAISLAPLPELVHNGSLAVDDIEDGSDTRRGQPALHVRWGVDVAINAGNFLYFLPLVLLKRAIPDPALRARVTEAALEDLARLHLGQALDIGWHNEGSFFPEEADYLSMCALKTGSLARMAARVGVLAGSALAGGALTGGALSGGADARLADALGDAFARAGVAFQILDDVKNLESGNPGKVRGDDVVEGKRSLPVLRAVARDPALAPELAALFAKARAEGASSPAVEAAIALVARTGALDSARKTALEWLDLAKAEVASLLPGARSLRDFFALLV